jgi:hypothetical protein
LFLGKIGENKMNKSNQVLLSNNVFHSCSKVNETPVNANYAFSRLISSNSVPFTNEKFIKGCLIETANVAMK